MERESSIERLLLRRVRDLGGIAPKLVAVGDRGFPDRTIILPNRRPMFIELKRPEGKLSPHQDRWIERLNRLRSGPAFVLWSEEQVKEIFG